MCIGVSPFPDQVRFSRPRHLPGLELVAARYERRAFPPHVHEEYVVGAMTMGAEVLTIRGESRIAAAGDLILIGPGEAHSNEGAGSEAFAYAVIYIPAPLIEQAWRDLGGDARPFERFREPVARNAALHRLLVRTHAMLARSPDALEQQSGFLLLLSSLFMSQRLFVEAPVPAEHRKVVLARDYVDAHFKAGVPLAELAAVAGLSPFHLLRSFHSRIGLPPAAYQTQLRIAEAKKLLRAGCGIAEAAAETGFADQSHLNRHFQRIVGTTPGRYAQQ